MRGSDAICFADHHPPFSNHMPPELDPNPRQIIIITHVIWNPVANVQRILCSPLQKTSCPAEVAEAVPPLYATQAAADHLHHCD